jgi:hypothetical protein
MRVFCHSLDRLDVTFDDEHLVANAGLMLPATLAKHLGLREFFDEHVDLGDGAGRGQCRPQGDDPRPLGGVGPAGTQVAATVAARGRPKEGYVQLHITTPMSSAGLCAVLTHRAW